MVCKNCKGKGYYFLNEDDLEICECQDEQQDLEFELDDD